MCCSRVSRRLGRCERVGSPGGRVARKKLSPGGAAGGSEKGPPRFAEDNFAGRGWHWRQGSGVKGTGARAKERLSGVRRPSVFVPSKPLALHQQPQFPTTLLSCAKGEADSDILCQSVEELCSSESVEGRLPFHSARS